MVGFLDRFAERIWYIHCKDCSQKVADSARANQWDYFTALRYGIFCELGEGSVDFPALLHWLAATNYDGYVVVEQDVLPGMGEPKQSARRNRDYLRSIELTLAGVSSQEEDALNQKKLNVGIIGAGRIGRVHAESLAFRLPESHIVAITDVSRAAAEQVAARCGISPRRRVERRDPRRS